MKPKLTKIRKKITTTPKPAPVKSCADGFTVTTLANGDKIFTRGKRGTP